NINLVSGFENKKTKTLLIFDKEILGEEINIKKRRKIDQVFISELSPKDYIVHIDHGIGIFQGVVQRRVDEGMREFLILEYGQGDKLYLPAEYTDKVSKYIGAGKPKINRLHEISWKELRKKVKEDAEKQARELLQIYAQRESSSGFIFSKNNPEEKLLSESFEYQETPDQLKAIEEIKVEMEGGSVISEEFNIKKPMDRLVCGDVGFGKTEIAIRASFKATQDKKQVAILCPTTLLAQQHFETFSKRLKEFTCKIEVLSRFKTKKEQKEIVEKLSSGKIDIIIGTHRLLSKDIKFSNLGLIIVDEEQRFGVKHKEKLKKLRPNVDIITLSATPIPRTLNLALSKLKNISILETPPKGRLAVETSIIPHNDEKIIKAIQFEIKRGGQVYYLHNRVKTIDVQLKRLKKLIPSARFGIIHGQLSEKQISSIMEKFNKNREIDVLICSSIIENGLDLPNVNTLIVDNSIMFGLADLHQLRGRIGRSKRKAYAYFFYKSQRLKEKARRRLEALLSAKELGAGFQIAMQDLEIRGAGNILGKQQSGNIKSVGLNLYCQLLNQAVKEIKTGKSEELAIDITIDLPITAYIPENLISDSKKRIKLYQELAKIHNLEDLETEKKQISAKYKAFPIEFRNLFKIFQLKILAKDANMKSIDTKKVIKYGDEIYRLTMEFSKIPPYKKMRALLKNKVDFSITDNLLKVDTDDLNKKNLFHLLKNTLVSLK
ncbi:MAG: transcription-repair coupling factor, partial [Parcubacteria group bacterium]|nr:transcription-repair coupling factor [Parcubacteria group bacterium]